MGVAPSVIVLDAAGNDLGLEHSERRNRRQHDVPSRQHGSAAADDVHDASRQAGWVNAHVHLHGHGRHGHFGELQRVRRRPRSCQPGVCQPQIGVSTSGKSSAATIGVSDSNGAALTTASFSSGTTGLTTFTYYSIPAAYYIAVINANGTSTSATTCSTTGWTKITTAGDLAATLANTAYVVRVFETDKLGNARCTDLASAAEHQPTTGALRNGGKFGVDKVAPTAAYVEPAADPTAARRPTASLASAVTSPTSTSRSV